MWLWVCVTWVCCEGVITANSIWILTRIMLLTTQSTHSDHDIHLTCIGMLWWWHLLACTWYDVYTQDALMSLRSCMKMELLWPWFFLSHTYLSVVHFIASYILFSHVVLIFISHTHTHRDLFDKFCEQALYTPSTWYLSPWEDSWSGKKHTYMHACITYMYIHSTPYTHTCTFTYATRYLFPRKILWSGKGHEYVHLHAPAYKFWLVCDNNNFGVHAYT